MRKNFGARAVCYPQPVFIIAAYDENGKANAMNAAWGGISEEKEISICISEDHKTTANLLARGAFTVSVADVPNLVAADYVGIASGNDTPDKLERAGWHAEKSARVDAPIFTELPMALECRLKSYDAATCRLIGEIVDISVDERILAADGKVDLTKFHPITYDPFRHDYVALGAVVGKAFSAGLELKK